MPHFNLAFVIAFIDHIFDVIFLLRLIFLETIILNTETCKKCKQIEENKMSSVLNLYLVHSGIYNRIIIDNILRT